MTLLATSVLGWFTCAQWGLKWTLRSVEEDVSSAVIFGAQYRGCTVTMTETDFGNSSEIQFAYMKSKSSAFVPIHSQGKHH